MCEGIVHIIQVGIGSLDPIFTVLLCLTLRYYTLAHAVNEVVVRQPSMLQAGTLRDYQLVSPSLRPYFVLL